MHYYNSGVESGFMIGFLVVGVILLIISIAGYVCKALGLYTMAKNRNINNPWLSWIPFGREYLLGELADPLFFGDSPMYSVGVINLLAPLAIGLITFIVALIPFIGPILSMAASIFLIVLRVKIINRILATYTPDNATAFTVLAVLIPFTEGFIYFSQRNKTPYDETATLKGAVYPRNDYYEGDYTEDSYRRDDYDNPSYNRPNEPRYTDDPEDREGPGSGDY